MAEEYISRQYLLDEYDRQHQGPPGGARKIIAEAPAEDVVPVVRCKDCIHNNECYIQYSAQAGDNFFCGFGETEKDVREDVYE